MENGKVAVLFIHGILGSPIHFAPFYPEVPSSWTKIRLVLDGHGKKAKDFSKTSMAKWKKQVKDTVQELRKDHSKILLVCHSMGTLFGIQEAVKGNISGLFLLNPPLKVKITGRLFKTVFSIYFGKVKEDDRITKAAENGCSIEKDPNPFHYIGWIPRYLELFREIRRTRKEIRKLKTETLAYLSADDEMVSMKSMRYLKDNPNVHTTILKESCHFYYSDNDLSLLLHDFRTLVEKTESRDSKA